MKKSVEKGITLIALVVTIVILLILAGISISMLTGENGIISQARLSKEQTIIGEEKDGISIAYSACKTDNMLENVTASQLEERMRADGKDVTVTQDGLDLKVRYPKTGHEYTVNQNGKIEEDSSNPDEIIDGMNMGDYAIVEKRSGEVLYVELDGDEGKIDTENATVITTDGIAQKVDGYFVDKNGKVYETNGNCISDDENSALKDNVIKQIHIHDYNNCFFALDENGKVYSMGRNWDGQLGDGTTENKDEPICISDIEGSALNGKKIIFVNGYDDSTFAVDTEGKVYAWGKNNRGELGDGSKDDRLLPICISDVEGSALNGKKIKWIHNRLTSSVALDSEGKVYTWGSNLFGQLGDGTKDYRLLPVCISDINGSILNAKKIVLINWKGDVCALDQDGKVYMWDKKMLPEYIQTQDGNKITIFNENYMLDSEGNLYNLYYNEQNGKKVLSKREILNDKKISLFSKSFDSHEFALDSDGIGYLKGYKIGNGKEFLQINNKEEYKIIKVNNFYDEKGLLYITDKGEAYYVNYESAPPE